MRDGTNSPRNQLLYPESRALVWRRTQLEGLRNLVDKEGEERQDEVTVPEDTNRLAAVLTKSRYLASFLSQVDSQLQSRPPSWLRDRDAGRTSTEDAAQVGENKNVIFCPVFWRHPLIWAMDSWALLPLSVTAGLGKSKQPADAPSHRWLVVLFSTELNRCGGVNNCAFLPHFPKNFLFRTPACEWLLLSFCEAYVESTTD
jgi:hypothetical protein